MTHIKFCGMARAEDVALAIELGVSAVGFVFWPDSPRYVDPTRAAHVIKTLPEQVIPVGVFVRPTAEWVERIVRTAGIRVAQIHGLTALEALPVGCEQWHARSIEQVDAGIPDGVTLVVDAFDPERHGGTGRTIDWERAAPIAAHRRVWLAGGLTPKNVAGAIRRVRPYGVDVASGIEDSPGVKNADAMRSFVAAVRENKQ